MKAETSRGLPIRRPVRMKLWHSAFCIQLLNGDPAIWHALTAKAVE